MDVGLVRGLTSYWVWFVLSNDKKSKMSQVPPVTSSTSTLTSTSPVVYEVVAENEVS